MKLAMNIPGYVQDAQKEYIDLLDNKYIQEIYLMAPYFSDDKVARSLIKTANKMKNEIGNIIEKRIKSKRNLDNNKKEIKKKVLLKLKEEKKFIYFFLKNKKID